MKQDLKNIKTFLLDLDGTLYLSDRLFEGTVSFLNAVRQQGNQFVLLTNNSALSVDVHALKVQKMNIPAGPTEIFTSAAATILYLTDQRAGARIFLLATASVAKVEKACQLILKGMPFIATHADLVCPTENFPVPDCGSIIKMISAA